MKPKMSNNMSFSQHGKVETNENDTEIIELSSDDEAEPPTNPQKQQQQQQHYNQPMNSSQSVQQIEIEIVHDSVHLNSLKNMGEAYQNNGGDGNESPTHNGSPTEDHFSELHLSEESDGDVFIKNLREKHGYVGDQTVQYANAQPGTRYLMDQERTSAPSPATPLVTSTTATMTPAHPSTPSPLPNQVFSTESQSQFENGSSQNINAEMNQKNIAGNLSFDELFKKADAQSAQAMAQLIDSKVKQHMEECMHELMKKYDLVPKGSQNDDAESKPKKQKRKHNHNYKKEKDVAENRSMKREKFALSSSESSLDDRYGPPSSTPNYSAGKRGASSSRKCNSSTSSNKGHFRCGNDFLFGRPKPQTKPVPKGAAKGQKDYGTVKNDDASLYLSSAAAKRCPLCDKTYKRMVNHFRKVHSNYEVFVSRLSPQMATTLKRSNLSVTKYARASGMQHLKMICPFCEDDKDFYVSYWSNHIRTHTGEYTNECTVCSTISLNASHCGQATIKQKCNLYEEGLSAYLCDRCNWIQLDENRVKSHVHSQHGVAGAYRKIVIIPTLNGINETVKPRNALIQSSSSQQLPLIAANERPPSGVSSAGIQVLESVVLHPPVLTANVGANVHSMIDYSEANDPFMDGLNIMAQANQMLNDETDDVQMLGDFPTGQNAASNIEMIKVDAIDDQVLQNVFDTYDKRDRNPFVVRPWMDDDYGVKKLFIDDICQFALYKCMYEKCMFATNSMNSWQIHMGVHGQLIDFFQKKGSLEKNMRDKLIMYRECPYCCFTAKADHQVLRHMEEDHRRSIFQCAMCYYRTIEMDNMVLHMQKYHPDATKEVLLCGETREFLEQDEEILQQDCENYDKKIQCGQGDCTEEYACYNSLYAHLVAVHPGTYLCPYCSQTMGLDEPMIVDHLKVCSRFPEFQCLKCVEAFDNVRAIREHMAAAHSSNYLFVGARLTKHPCEDQDEIQIVYIGDSQNTIPYSFRKCAQPFVGVLDGMDPKELNDSRQLNELKKLRMENRLLKTPYNGQVPRIEKNPKISLEFLRYSEYAELNVRQDKKSMPLMVSYKCITGELLNEVPTIANFIDREKDIDRIGCTVELTGSMASMLRHRCKKHPSSIVFLQNDQQLPLTVRKIVRCSYHCQLCVGQFTTRMDLRRHFNSLHSNRWIAAKISVKSQVIESNDPQQPIGSGTESIDYFCCTVLKCTQSVCNGSAGTRAEAIAHYNDEHHDSTVGSQIDGFQAKMAEHIIAHKQTEIEPYLQELRSSHQIYLFECQHCWKLFESLAAISEHFAALRTQNIPVKCRFSVKRLYFCLEDNTVRTLAGMQRYANENPNQKSVVPVNMQLPMTFCGMCNYNYQKKGNLSEHFEQKHVMDGVWCRDTYNDAFLNSLNLGQIDINKCQFASGCCNTDERNLLRQIVDHVLSCERRFRCKKCPKQKFTSTVSFVTHCIGHDQSADSTEIFEDLHNFKAFLALLANMQIILPNGLVLAMHEIRDTAFGFRLQGQIGQLAQESWEREKTDLRLMTIV